MSNGSSIDEQTCRHCGAPAEAHDAFCERCGGESPITVADADDAPTPRAKLLRPDIDGTEHEHRDDDPTAGDRPGIFRRHLPRLLVIGGVVAGLGLLIVAGMVGAWVQSVRADDAPIVVTRPVTVITTEQIAEEVVPNVLGLSADGARRVYLDAGLDPGTIEVVGVPYVGEEGLVVGQDPDAGAPVQAQTTLRVAEPATMPDLSGRHVEDARAELSEMGARVAVRFRYVAGTDEGVVVATSPATGAPLTPNAALIIAEAPSSLFLSALTPISSSCSSASGSVNGAAFDEGITCSLFGDEPQRAEYLLSRRADTFTARIGVEDGSAETGTPVLFRVIADGREVFSERRSYGTSKVITVPVSGVLRLHLEASAPATAGGGSLVAGWADARLEGGERALSALEAGP